MKSRTESLLEFYSKFRGRRPTVLEAFARQPPGYWFGFAAMFAFLGWAYWVYENQSVHILLFMVLTVLARDIGWMLRFKRDWPILDDALDWQKVEAKLKSQSGVQP